MFLSSLFDWSERCSTLAPRSEEELVTNTLTLELSAQLKRAEKMHRERAVECKRLKQGVDYSWLMAQPKLGYQIPPGEQLELQELCSKIKPSQCGPLILRFRKLIREFESEVPEIPRIFRLTLLDFIEQEQEEEARRILMRQMESKRGHSLSGLTLRSRLKINPFCQEEGIKEAGTGLLAARRVRSMPEFNIREDN
ncbi:protein RD3-like [Hemiscyllium ocellatum]|uniref:protein RD3-like n=1 Tax=Hemiscyllium ocellatum TaxID=170820 RepID=UPI0029672077|nr:protein RD3-like [Hemiscyllium ocellatum]